MMKKYILIIALIIISCTKKIQEIPFSQKVFPNQQNTDSIMVISLDTINDFQKLEDVFCKYIENDELRYFIRTSNADVPIFSNQYTLCRNTACELINYPNTIFIHNPTDTIFEHNSKFHSFTTKQFNTILEKQFLNKGKDDFYAKNPKRNIIFLNAQNFDEKFLKEEVKNKLDTISKSYINFIKSLNRKNIDSLKECYPLFIRLHKMPKLPPMPQK